MLLPQDIDFFGLNGRGSGSERYFCERYLSSPLIADGLVDDIESALGVSPATPSARRLKAIYELIDRRVLGPYNLGHGLAGNSRITIDAVPVEPDDLLELALPAYQEESGALWAAECASIAASTVNDYLRDIGLPSSYEFEMTPDTLTLFQYERYLTLGQRTLVARAASGDLSPVVIARPTAFGSHMIISRDYTCWVDEVTGHTVIATYNMFLSLLDMVRMRARVSLAVDTLYPDSSLHDRISQQIAWQTYWISVYGNEGYTLAKATEALCKSLLTKITDPDGAADHVYEKMWEKVAKKNSALATSPELANYHLMKQRASFERYTSNATIQELVELFGVQKLTGHPFIFVERGGSSAAKEALEHVYISQDSIQELRGAWASLFLEGFIRKERRWPNMHFAPESAGTHLKMWHDAGFLGVQAVEIPLSDWAGVEFAKTLDFNYHESYIPFIDDKALSYERDVLDAYWDKHVHASTSNRLLLEITSRTSFSYRAIVDRIVTEGAPYEWRVVALFPKERELKIDARMFAIMVLEMRTYFAGAESNLAQYVYPYLSTQTMTKDKAAILEHFYKMTAPASNPDNLHLFIECDLSRWNLRWRASCIDRIGADLNALFGVKGVFTFVHEFFESALCFVRTPRMRPAGIETGDPPASDLCWYNHKGGFEGIAQKLWTIATYAMVYRALVGFAFSFILVGQGDNQVLSIHAARDQNLTAAEQFKTLADEVLDRLEHRCLDVNQELKPEECIESRTVVTYSKDVWVNGMQYFLSLKYLARAFARTNNELPSMEAEMTALHSACQAAAEHSTSPLSVYLIAIFLSALEYYGRVREEHPEWSRVPAVRRLRLQTARPVDFVRMMWLPAALGGLSGSMVCDYLHRGDADPAMEAISTLLRGIGSSCYLAPLGVLLAGKDMFSPDADPVTLLSDPYCLPIRTYATSESAAKTFAAAYLQTSIRNNDLKLITSRDSVAYGEEIKTILLSMTPLYPAVAREIYDCTVAKEADRLNRMFTSTQTVQAAARAAGSDATAEIVLRSGASFHMKVDSIFNLPETSEPLGFDPVSAHRYVVTARQLWEHIVPPIEGVTSLTASLFSAHITDFPSDRNGVKLYAVLPATPLTVRGPYRPYLGRPTKLNRSAYGYKLISDSRPAASLRQLSTLISLPGLGPSARELITHIATSRGPVGEEFADLAGRIISGHTQHRFHGRDHERGSYTVGQGNLATHVIFNSEEFDPVSGSAEDYPVMFQGLFTWLLGLLGHLVTNQHYRSRYVEITLSCPEALLVPLPIFAADVPDLEGLTAPDAFRRSTIVYDPNVWSIRLSGPLTSKVLIPDLELVDLPDDELIDSAVRALASATIPSSGLANDIMDGMLQVPRRLNIDVPEMIRLGGERLFAGLVWAATIAIGRAWIGHLAIGGEPAHASLYSRRVSQYLAPLFLDQMTIPRMAADSSIQEFSVSATPDYTGRHDQPVARIAREMQSRILYHLTNDRQDLRRVVLFGTERGGIGSEVCLGLIGVILLRQFHQGTPWETVRSLAKTEQLQGVLAAPQESKRLRLLAIYLRKLRTACAPGTLAARSITRMLNGELLGLRKSDVADVIRLARCLPIPDYIISRPEPRSMHRDIDRTASDSVRALDEKLSLHADIPIVTKLRYTLYGLSKSASSHYATWAEVLTLIRGERLFLVGVGHGVAARAALDGSWSRVIGCDLRTVYPMTDIRNEVPPREVIAGGHAQRFHWSPVMLTTTGDVRDPLVVQALLENSRDADVFVLDIRGGASLRETLECALQIALRRRLVVRIWTTSHELPSVLYEILLRLRIITRFPYRLGTSVQLFAEVAPHLASRPSSTRIRELIAETGGITLTPPVLPLTERGGTARQRRDDALRLSLWGDNISDLPSALFRARAMIGAWLRRDDYRQWTVLLAQQCALEWLIMKRASIESLVAILCSSETTLLSDRGVELKIAVTEDCRDILTGPALRFALRHSLLS